MSKNWGTPTWYFFHTLAEKVKDDEYSSTSTQLLSIIKNICSVLPCPECRDHAMQYTSRLEPQHVNTKDKFKLMLFGFHNEVNKRTGSGQYPVSGLELYKRANFTKIFALFRQEMLRPLHNNQISDAMRRKQIINSITNDLQRIAHKFNA